MASLTPAAVQNENLHIHRGKGVEGSKIGAVQNENLHIHRGKGLEGFKAEVPKPVKTGRQERKALRDLSQAAKPFHSCATKGTALKDKSAATKGTVLKDKSAAASRGATKKVPKSNILTDEEIAKCREWAKEGIEHMHFSGNDMQKFEGHQQEELVRKKVDKVMSALQVWNDMTFGLKIPVKDIPSDNEDNFKLEFEPEVLPPTPRANLPLKSGHGGIEDLYELDFEALYLNQQFEMKLMEEHDSAAAIF